MTKPVMLVIRDGWGINPGGAAQREANGDATLLAHTPFHDQLYREYPMSKLSASGLDVGLPEGQMGNSEVGHLNLGAGRIVYQDLTRINKAIADGELERNTVLQEAFEPRLVVTVCTLLGLVSDGGVHSHYFTFDCAGKRRASGGSGGHFGSRFYRWTRHLADRRCGILGNLRGKVAGERRANRDSRRPIFRDGSRQALGSH